MTLELPQGRNANVVVAIAEVVDAEASRGEATNNRLIALNILLTACIGPGVTAKKMYAGAYVLHEDARRGIYDSRHLVLD